MIVHKINIEKAKERVRKISEKSGWCYDKRIYKKVKIGITKEIVMVIQKRIQKQQET